MLPYFLVWRADPGTRRSQEVVVAAAQSGMATPMEIGSSSGHTGATQQGSVFNYVVTAHKPTAVIKSVVGSFTGPNDTNLIIA